MTTVTAPPAARVSTLARMQETFARLVTDVDAVAALGADPAGFASQYGDDVARALAAIDVDRLQGFARSLQWKRLREARRLLPFTSQAMGAAFAHAFLHHANRVAPSGGRKPLADAMAFARTVRLSDRRAREAARFEWHSLSLAWRLESIVGPRVTCAAKPRSGLRLRVCRFDYEFPALPCAPDGRAPWPRRTTVVLFASAFGRWSIWYR